MLSQIAKHVASTSPLPFLRKGARVELEELDVKESVTALTVTILVRRYKNMLILGVLMSWL